MILTRKRRRKDKKREELEYDRGNCYDSKEENF